MSQNPLQPDDPRLTAFALGELDPTEQAAFERLLADSPAAQAAVVEILELAGKLMVELRQEPAVGLTTEQRSAILMAGHPAAEAAHDPVNNVANHSHGPAVMAGLPDAPRAAPSPRSSRPVSNRRVSNSLVKRFASLAAAAALVVVVAVMMSPARPHTELPILLGENGTYHRETHMLGMPLDAMVQESESLGTEVSDFSAEQQGLLMSDGTVRFHDSKGWHYAESLGGGGSSGDGRVAGSSSSPVAAGAVPWQVAQQEHDVAAKGLGAKPATLGRSAGASSGKRDMPPDGEHPDHYHFGNGKQGRPVMLNERSGSMGGKGLGQTGPAAEPKSGGRAAGIAGVSKPAWAGKQVTERRGASVAGEGFDLIRPVTAPVITGGGTEMAKQESKPASSVATKKLNLATDSFGREADARRNFGLPEMTRRKADVRKGVRFDEHAESRIGQPAEPAVELKRKQVNDGIADEDAPQQIRPEKLEKEVTRIIDLTDKVGAQDPVAAAAALKRTLTTLASSKDIDPQIREKLRSRAQASLDQALAGRDKVELDRIATLERTSARQERELAERLEQLGTDVYADDAEYLELKELQQRIEYRRKLRRAAAPGTEDYEPIIENQFFSAYENPLSTFGVDVDTASYANVRRFLTDRQVPPPDAVRIEEFVNYFKYDYPQPAAGQPFSVNVEAANCAWNPGHQLVRIALKGREIPRDQRPSSNLVFLVDVSGSMQAENKLPLVKVGLNLLTQQMTESDRVAIVTYSDSAVQRLESTNGTNKQQILEVVNSLQANGSTNGAAGIQLAYRAALDHFIDGGTNRVILCTDGDFNVGVTGDDELVQLIQERARTKVFFSVFGFGMGNLKDGKLEKLADKGNGHYAYIDGQREAHKMFVDELVGTLVTIAKDVKLQVEFNPNQVGAYRLIGYENRVMASQDFNNDKKDAGEVGAGHTVTALYEVVPADAAPKPELGVALRYRKAVVPQEGELARELLTVKLRYKLPEADVSTLLEFPAAAAGIRNAGQEGQPQGVSSTASREFNWAAAVAAFGMILRNSQYRGQANFDMVLELAQGSKGEDKSGQRAEFIELVKTARAMCMPAAPPTPTDEPQAPLTREQAEAKAGVNGKYRNLLRMVPAAGDAATYGSFHEFGHWEGTSYLGMNNLPQGFWVYVAPNWYIWGNVGDKSP